MNELDALLILNAVPGIGSAHIRKLLEHYGLAARVLTLSENDLVSSQIVSAKTASHIAGFPKDQFLQKEHDLITRHHIRIIPLGDESYPANLKEIPDPPMVLYVKGNIPENIALSVAMVGSRKASLYGLSVAQQFAGQLASAGMNIVSGMARGIDTAAHRGALKSKGMTTAVFGCGLAHIYPPENKKLFEEISATGAVVSEFPMETSPVSYHFPRRNRIISGLSLGVVVVEAAEKSGALITADFALEQGREVYAVPGKIDSPTSQGVHHLIKQGAKLVISTEDILEDLCLRQTEHPEAQDDDTPKKDQAIRSLEGLSEPEQLVYRQVTDSPIHIDDLSLRCGSDIPSMASVLLSLELKRLVKQLPGKLFVR